VHDVLGLQVVDCGEVHEDVANRGGRHGQSKEAKESSDGQRANDSSVDAGSIAGFRLEADDGRNNDNGAVYRCVKRELDKEFERWGGARVSSGLGRRGGVATGLTSLGHDASNPRAVVVHFLDASFDLAAVVRPVHLPVATGASPARPTVRLANKHILGVELLEARAVGIVVRASLVSGAGFEVSLVPAASFCLGLGIGRFWPELRHAGVGMNDGEYPEVCRKRQEEEYKVQDEEGDGSAGLLLGGKEEID
jgi:hypothetical protein